MIDSLYLLQNKRKVGLRIRRSCADTGNQIVSARRDDDNQEK
jgi:ribosomal protein L34